MKAMKQVTLSSLLFVLLTTIAFAADPVTLTRKQAGGLKTSKLPEIIALRLQCCFTDGGWCSCAAAPNPDCRFFPYRQCEVQSPVKVDDMDKFAGDILRPKVRK